MPPKAETVNAVAMIQDRLGVDEARARDISNVAVRACEATGVSEASIGYLIENPRHAAMGAAIVDGIVVKRDEGSEIEKAVKDTLGFSGIKDEAGGLARITQAPPAPEDF